MMSRARCQCEYSMPRNESSDCPGILRAAARQQQPKASAISSLQTYGCHLSVEEHRLAFAAPAGLVGSRQRVQIGGRRRRIAHPASQQIAPVDHVDCGAVLLVLIGKVAPDL